MKTVKKHFSLLSGIGFFVGGFFSFNHSTYIDGYYYDEFSLVLLVAGSIFIAIGTLKIREQK